MNKLFLCLGTPLIALILSPSASAAYQSAYYESFAGIELAAGSLASPSGGVGLYNGNATNIAVAGGKVHFQDGVNIYSANPDLSGVTLFNTNGVAPTDLAVDAVNGIYYESFAGIELAAGSLADPSGGVGIYNGNATNIAVAGGKVYFQDGVNIYSANPDLSGVTLFHTNGIAPTDLAVYVAATVPEPATWALMVAGAGLLGAWRRRKTDQSR
jgi:hypothetical protein